MNAPVEELYIFNVLVCCPLTSCCNVACSDVDSGELKVGEDFRQIDRIMTMCAPVVTNNATRRETAKVIGNNAKAAAVCNVFRTVDDSSVFLILLVSLGMFFPVTFAGEGVADAHLLLGGVLSE